MNKAFAKCISLTIGFSSIVITIGTSSSANADPFVGLSAFPMNQNFPCEQWFKAMEGVQKPAMAVLWGTFGRDKSCANRFMNQNRNQPHLLEIHFSNQTCLQNLGNPERKCQRGELTQGLNVDQFNQDLINNNPDLIEKIKTRVQRIKAWVDSAKNSNTQIVLSTGLEDNYKDGAYGKMVELIREAGWSYPIARNPEQNSYQNFKDANYLELHPGKTRLNQYPEWNNGNRKPAKPGACIVNLDGVSAPDEVSVEQAKGFIQRHQDCYAVFLWNKDSQGLGSGKPPMERDFSLSNDHVSKLNDAMRNWR
ncbi:hypothetical protein H6G64_33210 [Calothrix sp. FACHB-156]|nr:hypothetical protein [Calothrix sp. FACHB-156]